MEDEVVTMDDEVMTVHCDQLIIYTTTSKYLLVYFKTQHHGLIHPISYGEVSILRKWSPFFYSINTSLRNAIPKKCQGILQHSPAITSQSVSQFHTINVTCYT